jgi:hypothetical protein
VALSVIVRWEPAGTAVNGTVVARPLRTTGSRVGSRPGSLRLQDDPGGVGSGEAVPEPEQHRRCVITPTEVCGTGSTRL